MTDDDPRVEPLADLEHEQWSGWHRYVLALSHRNPDGSVLIPAGLAARWERQMNTPYAELPDDEQESDRIEARRVLALLRLLAEQDAAGGPQTSK